MQIKSNISSVFSNILIKFTLMENFLPALLIIGGVIYKIYSEYQKEQEKARRRMPQVPQPPLPIPSEQRPQRTVIEPTMSIPIPVPPKKTERSPNISEEVRKMREKRSADANSIKKVVVKPVVNIESEKEDIISFDLREAVIQSAILNRPYQ